MIDFLFILNSVALGAGLAADAFSASIANGISEPDMKFKRIGTIAGTFGGFQFAMPLLGWFLLHSISTYFEKAQKFIPWCAFFLLLFLGGRMIVETFMKKDDQEPQNLSGGMLLLQGIATSIDALSVGFAISEYGLMEALVCSLTVGLVTFVLCTVGLKVGKLFGEKLAGKATVVGGLILIIIGIEILAKAVWFS